MKDSDMLTSLEKSGILFFIGCVVLLISNAGQRAISFTDMFTFRLGRFFGVVCVLSGMMGTLKLYEIHHGISWKTLFSTPYDYPYFVILGIVIPFLVILTETIVKHSWNNISESILSAIYLLEGIVVQLLTFWIIGPIV